MACVTLKRPLDFDPLEALHSPNRPSATKRRRCTPIKKMERDGLPFRNPAAGMIPPSMATGSSYQQYQQLQQLQQGSQMSAPSVFKETPLSPAEVANNLRDELKRMKRRRQLVPYVEETAVTASSSTTAAAAATAAASTASAARTIHSAPGSPEPMEGSSTSSTSSSSSNRSSASTAAAKASGSSAATASSSQHQGATAQPLSAKALVGTKEKPVFTLKQMSIICERMCQERTDKVRQEYDKILQQKLSEQYDAFVKFIDHQIQQRFNQSQLPSYLS